MKTSVPLLAFLLVTGILLGADPAQGDSSVAPDPIGAVAGQSPPAADQSGRAITNEMALATDVWPLVGEARLKVLIWEVYDSVLFTPSGQWHGDAPYRLSLRYLRNIPAAKLVEETEKAWQHQGISHPRLNEWLALLDELWPDITEGDNLVFGLSASGDSAFWFNGSPLGGIDDRDFGPLFGGIWMAPDTPRPALRARLIGLASESAQTSRPY